MKLPYLNGRRFVQLILSAALLSGCSLSLQASSGSSSSSLAGSSLVTQADIDAALPGIVCWGDSITYGLYGDGINYPDVLEELIDERLIEPIREATGNENLTAPEVVNLGVSAETTLDIAGRQGSIPLVIAEDFTIPSDCIEVDFEYCSSERADTTKLILGSDGGVTSVTICGVEGELIRWYDTEADHSRYRFRRFKAGDAVMVSAGELMLTNLYDEYLDYIPIIRMGSNGGWTDLVNLAVQFQAMLAHTQSQEQYIIAATPLNEDNVNSNLAAMQEMDNYMTAIFGEHAVSLRLWMSENGLQAAADWAGTDAVISDEDAARIAQNLVPLSLLNEDRLHYTAAGYAAIGEMFYEKLDELGYFDALKALAQ